MEGTYLVWEFFLSGLGNGPKNRINIHHQCVFKFIAKQEYQYFAIYFMFSANHSGCIQLINFFIKRFEYFIRYSDMYWIFYIIFEKNQNYFNYKFLNILVFDYRNLFLFFGITEYSPFTHHNMSETIISLE